MALRKKISWARLEREEKLSPYRFTPPQALKSLKYGILFGELQRWQGALSSNYYKVKEGRSSSYTPLRFSLNMKREIERCLYEQLTDNGFFTSFPFGIPYQLFNDSILEGRRTEAMVAKLDPIHFKKKGIPFDKIRKDISSNLLDSISVRMKKYVAEQPLSPPISSYSCRYKMYSHLYKSSYRELIIIDKVARGLKKLGKPLFDYYYYKEFSNHFNNLLAGILLESSRLRHLTYGSDSIAPSSVSSLSSSSSTSDSTSSKTGDLAEEDVDGVVGADKEGIVLPLEFREFLYDDICDTVDLALSFTILGRFNRPFYRKKEEEPIFDQLKEEVYDETIFGFGDFLKDYDVIPEDFDTSQTSDSYRAIFAPFFDIYYEDLFDIALVKNRLVLYNLSSYESSKDFSPYSSFDFEFDSDIDTDSDAIIISDSSGFVDTSEDK
jgi:hypothetical protein